MTHEHEHRDFVCRDCGALITCLSCIEVRAGTLPHGPAFVNLQPPDSKPSPTFETIGVDNNFDLQAREPATLLPPEPSSTTHQQSLFA
jgi:hypothetical protein